ncbi:hypothetical protein [Streptomyces sp. NPDC054866]
MGRNRAGQRPLLLLALLPTLRVLQSFDHSGADLPVTPEQPEVTGNSVRVPLQGFGVVV